MEKAVEGHRPAHRANPTHLHSAACSLALGPDMTGVTSVFLLALAGEFSTHSTLQGGGDQAASPQVTAIQKNVFTFKLSVA